MFADEIPLHPTIGSWFLAQELPLQLNVAEALARSWSRAASPNDEPQDAEHVNTPGPGAAAAAAMADALARSWSRSPTG